jgi:hypothetical protein
MCSSFSWFESDTGAISTGASEAPHLPLLLRPVAREEGCRIECVTRAQHSPEEVANRAVRPPASTRARLIRNGALPDRSLADDPLSQARMDEPSLPGSNVCGLDPKTP